MTRHVDFLERIIRAEAEKLILRHQRYASWLADESVRRERRSGVPWRYVVQCPAYWDVDPGFNPYKVKGRAAQIAYAMDRALRSNTYSPRPAVSYDVPKAGGGLRTVSVFQIADNALSRAVYQTLMSKNASRLSARCYAYRTDITLHDAIMHVAAEFHAGGRIYVAEFDFSKFFDELSHDHVLELLKDTHFLLTKRERQILSAFLSVPLKTVSAYSLPAQPRSIGIPQGTSVSLFLANAAAYRLDSKLEGLGVGFARYADDTLIWSKDYSEACRAIDALHDGARQMGVELNFRKSPGISILALPEEQTEFRSKTHVDFLGYCISQQVVAIRKSAVERIKDRMAKIIYCNLLEEPRRGRVVVARVQPMIDRDYVVMIQQIRRYLYGDLSEARLRRYLSKTTPRIHYKGLMSFYPLVDDEAQLKSLDGWLLHTVSLALAQRTTLLAPYVSALPAPHGYAPALLLRLQARSSAGTNLDLTLPSFVRIGRLLRRASRVHGPNAVANLRSLNYYPSA